MNLYPNITSDNPFASQSKLFAHWESICKYKETADAYPIFVEVNATNKCNLKCSWCISDNFTRSNKELEPSTFEKFCKEFVELGGKAITLSGGGEPTQHSQFIELVKIALHYNLELGLMTNGVFTNTLLPIIGNNFKWVRISLDTIDHSLYKQWKGIDYVDRVYNTICSLKSFPVKVGANINVSMQHTISSVSDIILYVYPIVDYIQFRPVLPRYFKKEEIEINKPVWVYLNKYKNFPKINLSLDKLNDLENNNIFPFKQCKGHIFNPVLDVNGDLKVCIYHPNSEAFTFGNIKVNTLSDIWASEQRARVKDYLEVLPYDKYCQICCKLTELNKLITFLDSVNDIEDKNFL